MKKYLPAFIFYVVSFIVIYVLNWLSPGAPDGGLGFGSIAIILLVFIIVVLIVVNIYKGFKKSKHHFILAGVHFLILLGMLSQFFI